MTASECIKKRRSVRTFDGTALREEDAKKIIAFAEKLENQCILYFRHFRRIRKSDIEIHKVAY